MIQYHQFCPQFRERIYGNAYPTKKNTYVPSEANYFLSYHSTKYLEATVFN